MALVKEWMTPIFGSLNTQRMLVLFFLIDNCV